MVNKQLRSGAKATQTPAFWDTRTNAYLPLVNWSAYPFMDDPRIKLSPSEKQTLRYIAEGDRLANEMDWIALQRLKKLGLIEDRASGFALT